MCHGVGMLWCWGQMWWGEDLQSEHVMKRFKHRGSKTVRRYKNERRKPELYVLQWRMKQVWMVFQFIYNNTVQCWSAYIPLLTHCWKLCCSEKRRKWERLSAKFHFVSVLERKDRAGSGDRGHALMSIWVNLIGYPSFLAKPCWEEVMWEDETPCDRWEVPASDLFSGGWRCDSSQSRREKGWVELMVRISVSILTSSLRG